MIISTPDQIRHWLLEAQRKPDVTHVIIIHDEFGHEDFPVYVTQSENVRVVAERYDKMQTHRANEIYSMALDFAMQLEEHRAYHPDS